MNLKPALFLAVLIIFALVPVATAAAPALSVREAKAQVAKTAEHVRRQMADDGANRTKVPGCWRNNAKVVSCFFSVYGVDEAEGYRWQCMLRVVVKLRDRPTVSGQRYRVTYGHAVCG